MKQTALVRRDHQLTRNNRIISILAVILGITVILQQVYSLTQAKSVRVFIPPQFVTQGGVVQNGSPDSFNVFGFTNYIISYINTWDTDAEEDYKRNIFDTEFYTTNQFKAQLNADYQARANSHGINELRDRNRIFKPMRSKPFGEHSVNRIAENVWDVTLYYNIEERIGTRSIKSEAMEYVFRVVYTGDNPAENQWGLRIDQLISEQRLDDSEVEG